MNQQDSYAAQSEHDAQCKCGWRGKVPTELTQEMGTQNLLCPACYAKFYPYPSET